MLNALWVSLVAQKTPKCMMVYYNNNKNVGINRVVVLWFIDLELKTLNNKYPKVLSYMNRKTKQSEIMIIEH